VQFALEAAASALPNSSAGSRPGRFKFSTDPELELDAWHVEHNEHARRTIRANATASVNADG